MTGKKCYPLVFLLLFYLLTLSGCEKCSPPQKAPEEAKRVSIRPEEINLNETKFAVIPEDYDKWDNITFSADGRQVFYKARKKAEEFIVVASADGENRGPSYKGVSFFVTSPDRRRFAFGGMKGEKKRLVVDNKELKYLYHEEVAPGAFSPDGRFVACDVGGSEEKEWFISVSDGEKEVYRSPVYPDTFRPPSFSPDGRLLVYELGDDKREPGNKGNKKRTVFFLDFAAKKIIKERLYTDGEQPGRFAFSADSLRVVYDITKEGKRSLVLHDFALNEERKIELPYASIGQVSLSEDGKTVIYIATKEGKHYLIESPWESPEQGNENGPYDAVSPSFFSPDSTAIAYYALKEGMWRIVVAGKEGAANYADIGRDAPVWSPDGAKIAYTVNKGGHMDRRGVIGGKWFTVISPVEDPAAVREGPAYDMAITPVWSPDGKYIAYRARTGTMENAKRFIVIADAETGKVIQEGPVSEEVWPPVWSADGKAAAYGARSGQELWWRVEAIE